MALADQRRRVAPQADAATLSKLRVGSRVLTRYVGYREWHERLCCWPTPAQGKWYVLTPDGDLYEERFDDADHNGLVLVDAGTGREICEVHGGKYRFVSAMSDATLNANVLLAREEAEQDAAQAGVDAVTSIQQAFSWDGRAVEAKSVGVRRRVQLGYRFPPADSLAQAGGAPASRGAPAGGGGAPGGPELPLSGGGAAAAERTPQD